MNYKKFTIAELFPILQNGKGNQGLLEKGEDCFYIGAKKSQNGVMFSCEYDSDLVQPGNCILFICNGAGSVGYTLYMDRPFIATSDIIAGYNQFLNPYIAMYLVTLLDLERPRYSYGRKWKSTLKNTTVLLPITIDGLPNWSWIESFMKNKIQSQLPSRAKEVWLKTANYDSINPTLLQLDTSNWKPFKYDQLFIIKKGKRLTKADMIDGNIPYIGAIDSNNGVSAYISNNMHIHSANTISVSYNGSVAEVYYQPVPFWATDDVNVFYPKFKMNKYIAMFLVTLIHKEKYRFNYGRKWVLDLMKKSTMYLPVLNNGSPDWQFIENYIKSLPFSANI